MSTSTDAQYSSWYKYTSPKLESTEHKGSFNFFSEDLSMFHKSGLKHSAHMKYYKSRDRAKNLSFITIIIIKLLVLLQQNYLGEHRQAFTIPTQMWLCQVWGKILYLPNYT